MTPTQLEALRLVKNSQGSFSVKSASRSHEKPRSVIIVTNCFARDALKIGYSLTKTAHAATRI